MTLKELRMWHYRSMVAAQRRCDELIAKGNFNYADERKRNSVFHCECVVALNAVVPGSVEQDIADAEKIKGTLYDLIVVDDSPHPNQFSVTGSIECHFTDKDAHKAFVEKDKFNGQEFGKLTGVQAAIASSVARSLYNPTVLLTPCPEHSPKMCPATCGHWLYKKE